MPHSQRVVQALQAKYEVFIATAAMEVPTSFNAKYTWMAKHFPFVPPSHLVYCGDKGILRADYLIDDNPRQLRRFGGEGHPLQLAPQSRRNRFPQGRGLAGGRTDVPWRGRKVLVRHL